MDKIQKAFDHMINKKKVRITKEGREFWCKPIWCSSSNIYTHRKDNIGQWFDIMAVRADSIDIVGVNHDSMEEMPIEYIKF